MESLGEFIFLSVAVSYVIQIIVTLLWGFIFRYFSKLYKRPFLVSWSWSWFAFAISLVGGLGNHALSSIQSDFFIGFTILLSVGSYLQILFLFIGSWELINDSKLPKNRVYGFFIGTLCFAFLITISYHFDQDAGLYRYFLRVGLKYLFFGCCLIITGILTFTHRKFDNGIGKQFMGIAFIIYGMAQLVYFTNVLLIINGNMSLSILAYFGVLDLFFIGLMGFGMAFWLLEDERKDLAKTNKELDSFLYSTSHDLRAPIASMKGIIHISEKDVEDKTARQYFRMIGQRVDKLNELISDILTISKSSKLPLKLENVRFDKLIIDDVIHDLKFNKGATKIRLDYAAEESHTIFSDYQQLKIILQNLIANGVKYHQLDQKDPLIGVKFKQDTKKVIIEVWDNGKGIREDSLSHIFDMFYRASEDSEGSGLGLYIVKEAVQKLGGTISVVSAEGEGTKFTMEFPMLSETNIRMA